MKARPQPQMAPLAPDEVANRLAMMLEYLALRHDTADGREVMRKLRDWPPTNDRIDKGATAILARRQPARRGGGRMTRRVCVMVMG
jgi:hypothetical protein